MPPKGKGKKGKKGQDDDDDFWAAKEKEIEQKTAAAVEEDDSAPTGQSQGAFDMLDDEDDDGAGLMGTINANKKGKKDKAKGKKAKKAADLDDYWDTLKNEEEEAAPAAAAPAAEAEEVKAEAEPVKEEEKEEATTEPVKQAPGAKIADPEDDEAADEDDDGAPKILTKAQKEKLKKEKEKEKKKAAAAKKKAASAPPAAAEPEPAPEAPVNAAATAADEDDEGEEEGGAGTGGDKKKKKKKKPAAKPAEAPAAPKGKKVPAHIAAMQAAMAEKQRLEEEAKRAEEERIRLIEEEDARIAAEEAKVAEQKALKKQKEKEKQLRLKAEGKLLTPAQKREKAAAEARKQAMLAAGGLTVAGLAGGDAPPRKAPFAKKGKPKGKEASAATTSAPTSPAPAVAETVDAGKTAPNGADEEDDDWDKDADEVEKVVAGVNGLKVNDKDDTGDDWDQSDDDDAAVPASPAAPASKKTASSPSEPATVKTASTPSTAAHANGKPAAAPTATTNGKASAAAASEEDTSSEEDDSDEDDSDEDSDDSSEDELEQRKARALKKIEERRVAAQAVKSKEDLRSPICCIMGHVDTGKTKLLDKIRQTNVQEGEAGGITQQIGATFFPRDAIVTKTAVVNKDGDFNVNIPGLLIIDTPGHESFRNLRTRGSSLCNIAILVVDITHGLEPQTIESIGLLKKGKTPFVVALNKIDRCYGWEPTPDGGFRESLAKQSKSTASEFEDRWRKAKLAFSEQGLNTELFDQNTDFRRTVSVVPTSAISGEGIPDMLKLLVKLTQERMTDRLMFLGELECTILEVKIIEGLGTTIDVILSNDGPITTTVRALLTPQPMREMRVKSAYVHHKECKAALGVKISAPGLEKAVAGARLYVAQDEDEIEVYKDMAMEDVSDLQRYVSKGPGVWVQASTLGSLEALLDFLKDMKIPVRNFAIGPVFRRHVLAASRMLDVKPEYAIILAFDVPIDREAEEYAKREGVRVFSALIIYHLFDAFRAYTAEIEAARKEAAMPNAIWPVRLKTLKCFATRDPIVLGVEIVDGTLRTGTPVGVVKVDKETKKRDIIALGKITSIEVNHSTKDKLRRGQEGAGAAIKIERASYQSAKLFGRHFTEADQVVSLITRASIDTLKNNFRAEVVIDDWRLIKELKTEQGVP